MNVSPGRHSGTSQHQQTIFRCWDDEDQVAVFLYPTVSGQLVLVLGRGTKTDI